MRLSPAPQLLLAACVTAVVDDSGDDTSDTADTDTGTDTGDTADTGTDTGDTADTGTDTADTGIDTADTGIDTGPLLGLSVELVAQGLVDPLGIVSPPGDPRLFLVERRGTIRVVQANGTLSSTFFLDLRGQVDTGFSEQGLLGLAFHPQFASNHKAYVNYTNTSGDTVVAEYTVDGDVADTGSKRVVLQVDQPYDNHNGGNLEFGPDGLLYIGLGDGGSSGDPEERAQNTGVLLGKMLRIDPLGGDAVDNDPAYGIPADNPWEGNTSGIREEIWSYGLRNPWRYTFDRQTGDLWIADVGQDEWEEIDFQPASSTGGENWGWDECEGTHRFPPGSPQNDTCALAGSVLPVEEYPRAQGCSITGGYVYRGSAIPWLQGRYLYADYCEGWIRSFVLSGTTPTDARDHTADLRDGAAASLFGWIAAFGQDADGELYFADHSRGKVWRIVPGP